MINQNDIFQELMKGADPEKLAQAYADALNAAIEQKKTEEARIQKEKEEAARKAQAEADRLSARIRQAATIVDLIKKYCADYFPKLDVKQMSVKDFDDILNHTVQAQETAARMTNWLDGIFKDLNDDKNVNFENKLNKSTVKSGEDPIADFLRKYGL